MQKKCNIVIRRSKNTSFTHIQISFIYLKIYIEFRSFGGICCAGILTLQKKVWWPRQTKLLVGFGLLFFLIGFDEFLQVFGGFSTGCGEAASSKIWQNLFFSQKLAQNQVLIPRPAFFRDLVDVGYMMMISNCGKYLSQPSLRTKISFIYLKSIQNSEVLGAYAAEAF